MGVLGPQAPSINATAARSKENRFINRTILSQGNHVRAGVGQRDRPLPGLLPKRQAPVFLDNTSTFTLGWRDYIRLGLGSQD